jgi:hypothetical protein
MRFNSEAQRKAYGVWNDAILRQADHRIDCRSGCSIMGDVCETGRANAAAEQQQWRAFHDIRTAEVTVA